MYFRGLAGSARACTSVVEMPDAGDVPAIPLFPQTSIMRVSHVARWSDETAAFATSEYIVRPLGAVRLPREGTYQIHASATPSLTYPTSVQEAVARLFAWREINRPTKGAPRRRPIAGSHRRKRARCCARARRKSCGTYRGSAGEYVAGHRGRAVYATAPWRALRIEARAAAGGRCQTCGRWCWSDGELHHRDPLARGGAAIPSLAGVTWTCKPCHFQHHNPRRLERAAWDRLLAELR